MIFFFDEKMLWKKGEREERDAGERKGRQTRREREREKQVYFNFPNQTYPSPSPFCTFLTASSSLTLP